MKNFIKYPTIILISSIALVVLVLAGVWIVWKFDLSHLKVGPFGGEAASFHLRYFGYYGSPWWMSDNEGVRDFSNIALYSYGEAESASTVENYINLLKDQDYTIIITLTEYFHRNYDKPESEWRTFLGNLKTKLGANLQEIWAFYLLDEPEGKKHFRQNPGKVERIINVTKEIFPDKKTFIVFYIPWQGGSYLLSNENLDLIATDPYFLTTDSYVCNQQNKQKFDNEVQRRMDWIKLNWRGGDQKIILVGQSFKCNQGDWAIPQMPSICQQKWYYDYAKSDSDIVGLLWYKYSSVNDFNDYNKATSQGEYWCLGVGKHVSDILKEHKKWGFGIVNETCNNQDDNDLDNVIDNGCDDDKDTFWDGNMICEGRYLAGNGVVYRCRPEWADLDDENPKIGSEKCNYKDDDLDKIIDEGCDDDKDTFWDGDMICDGRYLAGNGVVYQCKPEWADLDDENPKIGSEKCNYKDDDLDKIIDEGCDDDKDTFWDKDMICDGRYLAGNGVVYQCKPEWVDLDDENPKIGSEKCNYKDDDLDGKIDDGCDDDKDGFWDGDMICDYRYAGGYGYMWLCKPEWVDLDDENPKIGSEKCNNKDDDLDGYIDLDFSKNQGCDDDKDTFWDGDMICEGKYLAGNGVAYSCKPEWIDLDDTNPKIGSEKCNNKDDDLDKRIDDGCDDDKDTWRDKDMVCEGRYLAGNGVVYDCKPEWSDCDDDNPNIHHECP